MVLEVPGDGVGSGVEAGVRQGGAGVEDGVHDGRWGCCRAGVGPFRAGRESGLAFVFVAGEEFVDPGAGDPVGGGDLSDRSAFQSDSSDIERIIKICLSCPGVKSLNVIFFAIGPAIKVSSTKATTPISGSSESAAPNIKYCIPFVSSAML